ncbi:MAG: DUF2079 domain-containing protein [Acidimicrobiales bacterium]
MTNTLYDWAEAEPAGLDNQEGRRDETAPRLPGARRASYVAMGVLFLVMCAWSAFQWHRGGDGQDISDFNQSAWLIIHGNFNPYSSVTGGVTFLQDHFALFLYPLLAVYVLHPSGLTLLLLQDLACALASLVAILWIIELFERQLAEAAPVITRRFAALCVAGCLAMLAFDPWLWQGISFDFHMEAFSALFLVLAGRSFWRHRPVIAILWCMLALTTSDYAGLFVLALGVCVLVAGTGVRRWGLVAVGVGVCWILLVGALGDNQGDNLQAYAYITGAAGTVTTPQLAWAMAAHPGRWGSMLATKPLDLYRNLVPTGMLSVVSPWSFAVVLSVIVPAALLPPPIFLESGFQTIPAEIFGLCGSVFLLLWIGRVVGRKWSAARARLVMGTLCIAVFVQFIGVAVVMLPRIPTFWIRVSGPQGDAIQKAENLIPETAEVIVSSPVMGHFSGRQWVFASIRPGQVFPIERHDVYIVVAPTAGIISMEPGVSQQAITDAERFGAQPVLNENGVTVLQWHPPPGRQTVELLPSSTGG